MDLFFDDMHVLPGAPHSMEASLLNPVVYTVRKNKDGEDLPLHLHIMIPVESDLPSPRVRPLEYDERYPLVVYVQGSGWKKQFIGTEIPQLARFARSGFVVAVVEYRPADTAPFPAQIQDTKAAIRFLRKNAALYHVDTDRVVLWGDSSGGHCALMAGLTADSEQLADDEYLEESAAVNGIVDYYGPVAIDHFQQLPVFEELKPRQMSLAEFTQAVSPLSYISADADIPPIAIFHGGSDPIVPFEHSVMLRDKLLSCGKQTALYRIEGAGHANPDFWTDEVLDLTERYIRHFCGI